MFGNLGVHLDHFPSGKYGYVGSIPLALGDIVPATLADTLAGRSFKDDTGALYAYRFPVFDTADEAREHAKARKVPLCSIPTCACRQFD